MLLCFTQLDDGFHRAVFELDSSLKRTDFEIVFLKYLKSNKSLIFQKHQRCRWHFWLDCMD